MKDGTLAITVFVFLIIMTTTTEASKILVIPVNMFSHINLFSILGKALKDAGHEVWMLADDRFVKTITEREIIPVTFPIKAEDDYFALLDDWTADDPEGAGLYEKWLSDPWWSMCFGRICDSIMLNVSIMTTVQEQKFDLVVYDGPPEISCHLMIPYKFNIPFVTVHGFQVASWVSGVTGMPSIEPEIVHPFTNRMDFWQRFENMKTWLQRVDSHFYDIYTEHHMNRYSPENKSKIHLKKLAEKSEMYFMNYEVMCLDYPRVSAPNLKYLGGSSVIPPKPLPADLESFITRAEHGIILMTFGSMKAAQNTWKMIGEKIFDAFARLPQRVIVQYRLETIYGKVPGNVKLMKWLPQNDILAHRNVKFFITHGGNNGQNEATYHGVPMLIIPFFADQVYSGMRIEAHAYGKLVSDKKGVTSHQLYRMMTEILNNKTYAENIKKCSEIIRSMPTAQETFVFWVNHILRFGGSHLRPPSLDMPLYQVLMLDIVAYYVIYYLVIFHAIIVFLYLVIRCIKGQKAKKE
jgi:UDP:flavonoid glycosyltransferase YjiC (YdhE family)